jgi:hypothetical protein
MRQNVPDAAKCVPGSRGGQRCGGETSRTSEYTPGCAKGPHPPAPSPRTGKGRSRGRRRAGWRTPGRGHEWLAHGGVGMHAGVVPGGEQIGRARRRAERRAGRWAGQACVGTPPRSLVPAPITLNIWSRMRQCSRQDAAGARGRRRVVGGQGRTNGTLVSRRCCGLEGAGGPGSGRRVIGDGRRTAGRAGRASARPYDAGEVRAGGEWAGGRARAESSP